MDNVKLKQMISENAKTILGFAITRLSDMREAEELTSDIIYNLIRSIHKLRDEDRFYGFMWKVAENTYMDYLRKKSKPINNTEPLEDFVAVDNESSCLDKLIKKEELNLMRRELSLLTEQYRNVTVLYYMEENSCSEISEKLGISTEMVKYYLFRARKIIREGMNLERLYGQKSYHPISFEIDFWGTKAGDDREWRDFANRKIKGNILLAAYYSPVTIQEISIELGVAMPYLEDEIRLLTEREYLVFKNGKYQTNIPIFTVDCTKNIEGKLRELTEKTAEAIMRCEDNFSKQYADRFPNENVMRWQKILMCLHFSLIETDNDLSNKYGALPSDGAYKYVNGGGGSGIIWGRAKETVNLGSSEHEGIQGIYNGCEASDKRGRVVAMNFKQTLNSQEFCTSFTDPIVCSAVGCFEYLPEEWKQILKEQKYVKDNIPLFPVYSEEEYSKIREQLKDSIALISELNRKTMEIASEITADLAPTAIKKAAEYTGALVYQFNSAENLVNTLYNAEWIKPTSELEKPAIFVVKNAK